MHWVYYTCTRFLCVILLYPSVGLVRAYKINYETLQTNFLLKSVTTVVWLSIFLSLGLTKAVDCLKMKNENAGGKSRAGKNPGFIKKKTHVFLFWFYLFFWGVGFFNASPVTKAVDCLKMKMKNKNVCSGAGGRPQCECGAAGGHCGSGGGGHRPRQSRAYLRPGQHVARCPGVLRHWGHSRLRVCLHHLQQCHSTRRQVWSNNNCLLFILFFSL